MQNGKKPRCYVTVLMHRTLLFTIITYQLHSWVARGTVRVKSFCLRDRGRLGNEDMPISLKIGTQSRYVNLCNMPKFQLPQPFSRQVLDLNPSG